ncbi:hypothetical protein CSUI_004397 [Cystoisospora suis]|uniref:Uncharacterized protein n=1 Tax=Cystoisospora suis TaxID=483139 RepID=A0A2C6L1U6_9APIC|nr:hypothetical protein CSUI_004397 [Cystoisospora suis]
MQRLSIRRGGRRDSPSRQGEEPTASLPGLPGDEGGLQQPPSRQGETAEGSEDPAGSSSARKTKTRTARSSLPGQESSADSSGRSSVLLTMPAAWHRFRRRRHRSPPSTQEVEVPSPEPFRPSGPGFTIPTNEAVERFLLEQRAGPDVFGSSPPSSVLISPCRDCELREQLAASLQRDEELRRQAEATALALEADLEMEMARLEGLSASARSHLHDRLLTHTRAQLWSTRHTLKEAKQKKGVHTEKRHQLDGHAVERRKAESKLAETLRSRLRREQRERSEHSAAWVDGTRQQLLAAGISSTPPASGRSSPSMVGAAAPSSRQEDPRRDDDVHTRLRALNVLADTTVRRNRGPS